MECKQAELFKVLSVTTRIRIIEILREKGPLSVKEMAETLDMTASAVSQHLKVLRYAGLVRNERKGYMLPYEIDHAAMGQYREVLSEVCSCGCEGSCRAEDNDADGSQEDLAALLERERELQEELQELRARIKKMKTI
ncbi:MAG: metalloregulator ArsR/SmtB family transcription factor [Desulfohalobiaceae bacterium]|nr:metalloregulator ArsR/SmtB family transcription factor [Desulfohalobiaceae bacterium]